MQQKAINAPTAPQPHGGYAQAVLVSNVSEWLLVSGQIPESADGDIPESFEEQAMLVWANIRAQLESAGMSVADLVKVTTFLSSREFSAENSDARQKALGDHSPALTVLIADIYDDRWLLEIEAIAAR